MLQADLEPLEQQIIEELHRIGGARDKRKDATREIMNALSQLAVIHGYNACGKHCRRRELLWDMQWIESGAPWTGSNTHAVLDFVLALECEPVSRFLVVGSTLGSSAAT